MTKFDAAHPLLAEALVKRGFTDLTEVQSAVMAKQCHGRDLLVSAQTGSGKTVAFGLSMAEQLLGEDRDQDLPSRPAGLVITPTRELALQVKAELDWLYKNTGLVLASAVGGMDVRQERQVLLGRVDLLIGTPGRLVDHLSRHNFHPENLRLVILDEADEMLDMGFREDMETLLKASPQQRRTLMFSATVPRNIVVLAKRYQRDAVRVEALSTEKQHKDITYQACTVHSSDRQNAMINLLRYHDDKKTVIFCATRATVAHLSTRLANRGLSVVAMSGDLNQAARNQAIQAMRDGRVRVCVATDVAARGIDLPQLDLVIHADLPRTPDVLLHRSGRTGRAGRKGTTIVMVPDHSFRKAQRLLQMAGITADWARPPDAESIRNRDDERILNNTDLAGQPDETEENLLKRLVDQHSASQLALALIRQHRRDLAPPEELDGEGSLNQSKPVRRYCWFSLSVGKAEDMHVRDILSFLTTRDAVSRSDIGDIHLHHAESHVAIAETVAEDFLAKFSNTAHLSDQITVRPIDSPVIAEDRQKRHKDHKKRFENSRKSGAANKRRSDDRTDRPNKSEQKRKPSRRPGQKNQNFANLHSQKPDGQNSGTTKSAIVPEQDRSFDKEKKRKARPVTKNNTGEMQAQKTLSLRKKSRKARKMDGVGKQKQGGFKPVKRTKSH